MTPAIAMPREPAVDACLVTASQVGSPIRSRHDRRPELPRDAIVVRATHATTSPLEADREFVRILWAGSECRGEFLGEERQIREARLHLGHAFRGRDMKRPRVCTSICASTVAQRVGSIGSQLFVRSSPRSDLQSCNRHARLRRRGR
jgi:hypothetical protein